MTGLNADDSMH